MKAVVLATVAVLVFAGSALALECATGAEAQLSGAMVKLAMGPTSAAHLPGGTGQSTTSASDCTAQQCPSQKKIKHKHQS